MKKSQTIQSVAAKAERGYCWTLFLFFIFISFFSLKLNAQNCSSNTPTYTIDMTGKPDSIWTSPSVGRLGQCCNVSSPDVCILFKITLDTNAVGVRVEVSGGTGTTDYQNNCGNTTPVGSVMCLTGAGPHNLTICKPGGNNQVYKIYSIPRAYAPVKVKYITQTCTSKLVVLGMKKSTITWTAIQGSQYNTALSCSTGCDTTVVRATSTFPSYLDFKVCGTPDNACNTTTVCDTVRVYFVPQLSVAITPKNGILCNNNPTLQLTATPSGGKSPYTYKWSNNAKTSTISVSAGKYYVTVNDALNCYTATDTIEVKTYPIPSPIISGDSTLCEKSTNKTYNVTNNAGSNYSWNITGGTIISGANTNSITVNWGTAGTGKLTVQETFTSTGCNNSDYLNVILNPLPNPIIAGDSVLCEKTKSIAYSVTKNIGNTYSWSISGGTITSVANTNVVLVNWGNSGTGTLTLTETNSITGCKTTVNKGITLNIRPPKKTIFK